jgi:hypothetical protein
MYRAPCELEPGSAKNRSPLSMLLESEVMPVKFKFKSDLIPMKFDSSETDLT